MRHEHDKMAMLPTAVPAVASGVPRMSRGTSVVKRWFQGRGIMRGSAAARGSQAGGRAATSPDPPSREDEADGRVGTGGWRDSLGAGKDWPHKQACGGNAHGDVVGKGDMMSITCAVDVVASTQRRKRSRVVYASRVDALQRARAVGTVISPRAGGVKERGPAKSVDDMQVGARSDRVGDRCILVANSVA